MNPPRQHFRAIVLMVIAAALWSIAGVITRQVDVVRGFEITFWRSVFAAVFVAAYLIFIRRDFFGALRRLGWLGVLSGLMWCIMFICFMLALTMTTVSNTLIVASISPLLTALFARLILRTPITSRSLVAIIVATVGMVWMFSQGIDANGGQHLAGMLIALCVPFASSFNVIILKKAAAGPGDQRVDFIPAVFLGGVFSALLMLPLALPLQASAHDVGLMAVLGFFQLGLPCMLLVVAARHLAAPEIAMLALIEVLLGPLWAWLGAAEVPTAATLIGGAIVLVALVYNEFAALRDDRALSAT